METSADGAISEASFGDLGGGGSGYLDVDTPEGQRRLFENSTAGDNAAIDRGDFYAMAPDGTGIGGRLAVAVKQGAPPAGDGVYGEGNVCLFGGEAIG
jgi:hypothetical protein